MDESLDVRIKSITGDRFSISHSQPSFTQFSGPIRDAKAEPESQELYRVDLSVRYPNTKKTYADANLTAVVGKEDEDGKGFLFSAIRLIDSDVDDDEPLH